MIIRIHRATAALADRGLVLAHLRDRVYPANVTKPGLRTFQAGIRDLPDDRIELGLVSTWQDFDSLLGGLGNDLLRPVWLDAIRDRLEPVAADHYELVGEELRGVIPLAGGTLRVFTGRLGPGGEPFFEVARRWQEEQLDSGLIIASHLGRRMTDEGQEAVYAAIWRDGEAVLDAGGSPTTPANRSQWEPYFVAWDLAAYDAVARVRARRGAGALLLADDDRRLLYASPGAGALLGRPAARLLGRRIEELAGDEVRDAVPAMWAAFLDAGAQRGPFALRRADGTSVAVHYEARAQVPWPGVHASVLATAPDLVDFSEALAATGIVARYDTELLEPEPAA